MTIEHIMPQALTDWWKYYLGENFELQHDELLHTVGNLTLTGYNSDMGNYDFHRKKTILIGSHVELNRYFTNVTKWDEEEIRKRSELLADIALGVWPYFGHSMKEDAPIKSDSRIPSYEDVMLPLLTTISNNK